MTGKKQRKNLKNKERRKIIDNRTKTTNKIIH